MPALHHRAKPPTFSLYCGPHPKIKVIQRRAGKSADLRTRFKVAATTMKSGKGQRDAGKRSLAKLFKA